MVGFPEPIKNDLKLHTLVKRVYLQHLRDSAPDLNVPSAFVMIVKIKVQEDGVYILIASELVMLEEHLLPEFAYRSQVLQSGEDFMTLDFRGEIAVKYQYRHTLHDQWLTLPKDEWDNQFLTHRKRKIATLISR